ncbi:MAG: hypothetical protein Q8O46_03895 [bacterium]|nr:hypothetical protein [bacterium]
MSERLSHSPEPKRTYSLEHYPNADVLVNLDYPDQEDKDLVLSILKGPGGLTTRIEQIRSGGKFYIKEKMRRKEEIDFITGRLDEDPLNDIVASYFDKRARYGRVGVLNEIILSKKVKEIIASNEAQQIAQVHGYESITFQDPIIAVVPRGKIRNKFLVYKRVPGSIYDIEPSSGEREHLNFLVLELKKLFLRNGITPTDLRNTQFLFERKDSKYYLKLIDIEAFRLAEEGSKTEEQEPNPARITLAGNS